MWWPTLGFCSSGSDLGSSICLCSVFSPLSGCLNQKKKGKKWMKVCVYVLQVHALHRLPCIYLFVYVYKYIRICMYICVCVCVCVENLCFLGFCFWGSFCMSILLSTRTAQGCRWWMCCGWWEGWRRSWFCLPATRVVVVVVLLLLQIYTLIPESRGKRKKIIWEISGSL